MTELNEIVIEIRGAHGTNAKKDVLYKYEDHEYWKRFLDYVYNPTRNYYISGTPDHSFLAVPDQPWGEMFRVLDIFADGQWKGNEARHQARLASRIWGEPFRLVLNGSIKGGISTKTINAVYPDLIPTFDVMLADHAKIRKFPVFSSIKYDGVRLVARVDEAGVQIITRNGKPFDLQSLQDALSYLPMGVYDGELVHGDGLQESRTKITGLVNKVMKGSLKDIKDYTFCIFDRIALGDWDEQFCTEPYEVRLGMLKAGFMPNPRLMIVKQVEIWHNDDVEFAFKQALTNGYEGLIVRYPDDPYVWKRSTLLIKKKAILECVLHCYDVQPGTGKYEGMIGALLCDGVIDEKYIKVKVGTGLSDHDRGLPDSSFVGEQIEIEYNDIVKAENADHHSLFLPRYKRIRGEL